jgi:hypothetical protein
MVVTDRPDVALSADELERLAELDTAKPTRPTTPLIVEGRVLLAALSLAAGAIHLAMVPSHANEWQAEGVAFAVAGWLQIGLGGLFFSNRWRAALRVSCLVNIAFIAAWAVTRIWGAPWGPHSGVSESAGFVDITCVVLEGALVVVGAALLAWRPRGGYRLRNDTRAMFSVVPIGILAIATIAITSPSAANHAHGHSDVAGGVGAAHTHDAGTGAHDHGLPAGDDKGLSAVMNGQGEGGGHTHNNTEVPISRRVKRQLDAQLAQVKLLIDKYPTVAVAEAHGYHRSGPYVPALGTHYTGPGSVNLDGTMSIEDLAHPTLIYDGYAPDSPLAGFMYQIFSTDTKHAPEGFAGPNDHWHYHTNVCIVVRPNGEIDAPLGADTTSTKALCDKYGGFVIPNTGYMLHVWVVPGYSSPQGVFSNLNSRMTCEDGTYYIVKPEELGTRLNACRDAA